MIMVSQTNTPPPSSPTQFALEHPAVALKRKSNELDVDARPATKRRLSPSQPHSEQGQTGPSHTSLLGDDQAAHGGVQAHTGQLPPPVPYCPGHDQPQEQAALPTSRLHGKNAAKKLSRAAVYRPPGDGFYVYQGQAVVQPPPSSDPAQPPPPPHSTQNHGHWAYTVSNAGSTTYQQRPWLGPNAMAIPSGSGLHASMPNAQGQPVTGHELLSPPANFPGHYQPYSVFQTPPPGIVSDPILLDDTPQVNAPNTSRMQQPPPPPPQFPPVYSMNWPPFSRDFEESQQGVKAAANLPPSLPLDNANNLLHSFLPHTPDPSSGLWHVPGSSTPVRSEPMHNPYGFLDPQWAMSTFAVPYQDHQKVPHIVLDVPATCLPAIPSVSLCKPAAKAPAQKSEAPLSMNEPSLCPEQAALVDLIMQGHNVFYTGSAGCGKSTVLKVFVDKLTDMGKVVRIVAPTGRAALNVGGMTTWTFAGWTPNSHKKELERLKIEAVWSSKVNKRLKDTDVLVIDEISMVENLHFERLNEIMKSVHHKPYAKDAAFGGRQIIVTGDFCQLPPVKPFQHCIQCGKELTQRIRSGEKPSYYCRKHGDYSDEDKWAFRSKAWEECDFKNVHLRTIHRQNDEPFIRMLQKCRLGSRLSEQEIDLLMNHKNRTSQAIELYPTRKEADDVNLVKFNKIVAEKHTYWAHDSFFWHKEHHPNLQWKGAPSEWRNSWTLTTPRSRRPLKALEEHRYSECVQLKRGGLVVLLTNLDLNLGLCNGSQGVVCGFEEYDPTMTPTRDHRGEQSWSKRNSDKVEPQPGQRVLRGEHAGIQEKEIKNFITSECAPIKKWPIVHFHNGHKCTVYAECSITQLGDEEPYSLLARTQLPLAPAWAMTIHKSQSLTLDRVIVNLDRAFEEGQVYVALSRATGLYGLKIEGNGRFLRDKILVNSEVAAFLKGKFGDIYDVSNPEAGGTRSIETS